ncbi:hypothetical protein KC221_22720, partial [Mycobacterium tuberculosis]|nr:hypothetical protein [Mycobacterium tuberculosis]
PPAVAASSSYRDAAANAGQLAVVSSVIYYASRTVGTFQSNYTTTEKELLAVVFALDKFRPYILGSKVIFYTDHAM